MPHHPDKLISCNLLTETLIWGIIVKSPNIALISGDKNANKKVITTFARIKVQYSPLFALPSNVKNFLQV